MDGYGSGEIWCTGGGYLAKDLATGGVIPEVLKSIGVPRGDAITPGGGQGVHSQGDASMCFWSHGSAGNNRIRRGVNAWCIFR